MVNGVLGEVQAERDRQDVKWGEQNHEDGTGPEEFAGYSVGDLMSASARDARTWNADSVERGDLTWLDVLWEEVLEAAEESDPARLRAELIQVAAVAVAWCEAIDRRKPRTEGKGNG